MTWSHGERLYNLLPLIYRIRDAKQGEQLRTLLAIIESELEVIEADIEGLYENLFVETADEWVLPYIGDLVGNRPLHEVTHHRRADIAKTIYYRRRKGKIAMLEELAHDVTGWGAHAVEFFQLLEWTQNLNHLRFEMASNAVHENPNAVSRVGTVNLRDFDVLDRIDGPFDISSHTVDVRPPRTTEGWHNIRNIGFFLWRLNHYKMEEVVPRKSTSHPYGYHFNTLGAPIHLFTDPQREGDESGLSQEIHVPGPIRPLAFHRDLQAYRALDPGDRTGASEFYGSEQSLYIIKDGIGIPPENVICKDLKDWLRPPAGKVAIDVTRGRMTFASGEEPSKIRVDYTYGFSADMGAGPYDREDTLANPDDADLLITVDKTTAIDTIQKALKKWRNEGKPNCIITIADNAIYGGNIDISLKKERWLTIQAANGVRPSVRLVGISSLTAPPKGAKLTINGLLIEGGFQLNGAIDFQLVHSTLVPGRSLNERGRPNFPDRDSILVNSGSADMKVSLDHCISGPIRLPARTEKLEIYDSIVQPFRVGGNIRPAIAGNDSGTQPAPPTVIERSTLFGAVYVRELEASEVIFTEKVVAERRQVGCVRFSYLSPGSVTPRHYHCQPDLALAQLAEEKGYSSPAHLPPALKRRVLSRLRPEFTAEWYGLAGYGQLHIGCAEEIRTGAEDGSEMGAFSALKQPQREANLRIRLREYLPFGLQAGLIYVT